MTDEEIQEVGRQCFDNIGLIGHFELLEFAHRLLQAERAECAAVARGAADREDKSDNLNASWMSCAIQIERAILQRGKP